MEYVNHDNFDKLYSEVKQGIKIFCVPRAYGKSTIIDSKVINRFEEKGLKVLWLSKDGRGFRLASGKKSFYLCYTHLVVL